MFTKKVLMVAAAVGLLLASLPAIVVQAQDSSTTDIVPSPPAVPPSDILGYITHDGGKTWSPFREQPGVAERIPTRSSVGQFIAGHDISPDAAPFLFDKAVETPTAGG